MGDDEARQDEEVIDEQIGVLNETPVAPVTCNRHVKHHDKDGAHTPKRIQSLETAMGGRKGSGQCVHGRVIAPVKVAR